MTQAAHNAIHMQSPVGAEHHFQQNFAFQLQTASFVGVNRLRFESDLHRCSRGTRIVLRDLRSAVNHLLRSESAGRDSCSTAAAVAFASGRNTVPEVGASHRSLDALRSARSVSLSWTGWHVKSTGLRRVELRTFLARAL